MQTTPHRVYFVDDDPQFLAGLGRQLKNLNPDWKIEYLSSAARILEDPHAFGNAVIVLDWNMPGRSGIDICEHLRMDSLSASLERPYIIIFTGAQNKDAVVTALNKGADDFINKPVNTHELIARIQVGLRLIRAQQQVQMYANQLHQMAYTDPLTGISNRWRGNDALHNELARVGRGLQSLAILLIDIDHFKNINDKFGHLAGDLALQTVATQLKRGCREYDVIARWGGEEFLVICPQIDVSTLAQLGERYRRLIVQLNTQDADQAGLSVTVSIGVCGIQSGTQTSAETIIGLADQKLYEAKEAGRNRVCYTSFGKSNDVINDANQIRAPSLPN
ncbi:MAG: diguanylate cyclase [Gammaproteobacteria bacterium]|nr:diguanylate cyclase [Gammaproteobacteria bacterium]